MDRPVDGRRARRERGRLAVIDATIDLVLLGGGPPSADQVAERAGVSEASLFRYFDTLDDLRHQAIGRYLERHDHLMEVPDIGEHALDRRVRDLVAARLRYYETVQPMATLARRQAPEVPEVAATLARVRATLADQVAQHFEPELRSFRPGPRAERVAVLAALTSFESWQLLGEQGLDAAGIGRAWRRSLTDLLANRR
ncbi:MAG: TetR/AcrR family transcriptional regulator [Actinomycetota bacterium]